MELKLKRKNNVIATEMIAVQNNSFGMTLSKILKPLYEDIQSGEVSAVRELKNREEHKKLELAIKDRLGIKTSLVISQIHVAASMGVRLNSYSSNIYKGQRGTLTSADKKGLKKLIDTGYVDTKKAKVSGSFSQLDTTVYLNVLALVKTYKFTLDEVIAALLHEIGHIFNSIEYSHRLISTNFIMEDIASSINGDSKGKTAYAHTLLELDVANADTIAEKLTSGDNVIVADAMAKTFTDVTVGFKKYFETHDKASERLADSFASRFGYGRPLVVALSKLPKDSNIVMMLSDMVAMYLLLLGLATLVTGVLGIMSGSILPTVIGGLYSYMYFRIVSAAVTIEPLSPYDTEKRRYSKIRNDTVKSLKDSDLDKDTKKAILEDIYAMDKVIDEIKPEPFLLTRSAYRFVSMDSRRYQKELHKEDLLESLAANDLFTQATQLEVR